MLVCVLGGSDFIELDDDAVDMQRNGMSVLTIAHDVGLVIGSFDTTDNSHRRRSALIARERHLTDNLATSRHGSPHQ